MNLTRFIPKTEKAFLLSSIKVLAYLVLLIPFVNIPIFLFQTEEKTYAFRIIVELMFLLWLCLNFNEGWSYIKRLGSRNPLSYMMLGFLLSFIISTVLSVNPHYSFWSDNVRSIGLLTVLHVFAYFAILASVFESFLEWEKMMKFSILVALITSFIAISENNFSALISLGRIQGPMKNPAFFASYLIFNIFFAIFIAVKGLLFEKVEYSAIAILLIVTLLLTGTRGAMVGLAAGLIVAGFLSVIYLDKSIKIKKKNISLRTFLLVGGALILAILSSVTFMAFRDKSATWVQNTPFRYVTKINLTEGDIRLRVWGVALKGFAEKPIFGWGPENFTQVFNKYYDPGLYSAEFRFDRAHSIVFDTLVNQGLVGLIFYLGIIAVSTFFLLRARPQKDFTQNELFNNSLLSPPKIVAVVFVGLIVAYFVQNLFVFDTTISLFMFFFVLAFIYTMFFSRVPKSEKVETKGKLIKPFVYMTLIVLTGFFIWTFNIKVGRDSFLFHKINTTNVSDYNEKSFKEFESIVQSVPIKSEVEMEIMATYASNATKDLKDENLKNRTTNLVTNDLKNYVSKNPYMLTPLLGLSDVYAASSRGNRKNFDQAVKYLEDAIKISPQKQTLYFRLAEFYIDSGETTMATKTLDRVRNFDPEGNAEGDRVRLKAAIIAGDEVGVVVSLNQVLTKTFQANAKTTPALKKEDVAITIFTQAANTAIKNSKSEFLKKVMSDHFDAYLGKLLDEQKADTDSYFKLLLFEIDLGDKVRVTQLADFIAMKDPASKADMVKIKELTNSGQNLDNLQKVYDLSGRTSN